MKILTVYYDSECSFCVNVKKIIEKLDTENQIGFEPLDENEGELKATDRNGNTFYSEDVVTEISKILPGIKRFSWMFKGEMGKKTSKLFYQGLEKIKDTQNRLIGKCGRC